MGRHEIRLRRKKMTSRRIESHKNYYDLLKKHERSSMWKRVVKMILYIILILSIIFIGYAGLRKLEKMEKGSPEQQPQAQNIENKTSRPGVLINVSLNTRNDGKT